MNLKKFKTDVTNFSDECDRILKNNHASIELKIKVLDLSVLCLKMIVYLCDKNIDNLMKELVE